MPSASRAWPTRPGREANEYIRAGNIGHVLQGPDELLTATPSCGQWRYYPLKDEMTPKTIDWKHVARQRLRDRRCEARADPANSPVRPGRLWAQWRCYWPFGGGMFTDLFVHQTTHMIRGDGRPLPGPGRRRRRHLPRVRRPGRAGHGDRRRRLQRGLPVHRLGDDVQRHPARRGHPRPARDDQVPRRRGLHGRLRRCTARTSPAARPSRSPGSASRSTPGTTQGQGEGAERDLRPVGELPGVRPGPESGDDVAPRNSGRPRSPR